MVPRLAPFVAEDAKELAGASLTFGEDKRLAAAGHDRHELDQKVDCGSADQTAPPFGLWSPGEADTSDQILMWSNIVCKHMIS